MSTYVVSDIHGHKKQLDEMLSLIDFGEDDELYILGDIVDKGPETGELIRWAVEQAPQNVHFLLGNHEDMAYSALKQSNGHSNFWGPWDRNGGYASYMQLADTFEGEDNLKQCAKWVRGKLLDWIRTLPLFYQIEVGGRRFTLVHAGLDPKSQDNAPDDKPHYGCDENMEPYARRIMVNMDWKCGHQYSQDLLWERGAWLIDTDDPDCEVVFGHTYLSDELVDALNEQRGGDVSGGGGKIAHMGRKHSIDCGCAHAQRHPDGARAGIYRLGCLRLDDMAEFYVNIEPTDE